MDSTSRRRLLATCGGAAAAAVAGCLDGVLDSSAEGDEEPPGGGTVPDDARWFPAPAAFDRETYGAFSVDVAAFYDRRESLSSTLTDELSGLASYPVIDDPGQLDTLHLVGNRATVATGDLVEDAVIGHYEEEEEFERVGTHEGFTLLEGTIGLVRPSRAFAIRDGAMVAAPRPAPTTIDRSVRWPRPWWTRRPALGSATTRPTIRSGDSSRRSPVVTP